MESDALVGALMSLSTKTNTHILCVLHTNPGSDKARGHLGSSLQRKAETVIYVHRNGKCSVVERATLTHKITEVLNLAEPTSKMRIRRLIDRGILHTNGNLVCSTSNKVTK